MSHLLTQEIAALRIEISDSTQLNPRSDVGHEVTWLDPEFIRQLPPHGRLRARIFQTVSALLLIGPVLVEGSSMVFEGKVLPTLPFAGTAAVLNVINYLIALRTRRLGRAMIVTLVLAHLTASLGIAAEGVHSPMGRSVLPLIMVTTFLAGKKLGALAGLFWGIYFASFLAVLGFTADFNAVRLEIPFVIAIEFAILGTTTVSYVFERERETYSQLKDDLFEIVDRSTDLVGMTRGGKIVYHNPAFNALSGRDPSRADVRARDFHPAWAAKKILEEALPAAIRTGSWTGETALLDREGREVPVLQSIQVFSSQDGEMIDGATIIKDLTQIKAAQQQLVIAKEQAETALHFKSRFLANMSHEIRTPLNGMLGMAQLLAEEPLSEQARQRLNVLLNSGDHLMTLINDILDLAKLEAGKLTLESTHFRPAETIESALNLFAPQAQRKGIELSVEVSDPKLGVVGDEARYRQVLYNLLSNAIKFTEEGSVRVSFVSHVEDGVAHMTTCVRDTGIGIAHEKQSAIFEAFEQEDSSTARRFGGSGLGLSISAKLVELFGGRISLVSKPGDGSTFSFTITAPLSNEVVSRRELTPDHLGKLGALKVIVAEDNRVNQLVIGGLLKKFGIVPTLVANGVELLDQLEVSNFDVILMDCHMPEMDGFEATERIVGTKPGRPYIIALTASALAEDRERCMSSGMDEFLAKPVRQIDLAQALERAERKRAPSSPLI